MHCKHVNSSKVRTRSGVCVCLSLQICIKSSFVMPDFMQQSGLKLGYYSI